MKNRSVYYLVVIFSTLLSFYANAQNFPGKIIRPAAATDLRATNAFPSAVAGFTGANVLDPDGNGTVSASATGFSNGNDVVGSEVNNKPIVPYTIEPYGDLRRGPSHMFSDFVPGFVFRRGAYFGRNSDCFTI